MILSTITVFAYKPPRSYYCASKQYDILRAINLYFEENNTDELKTITSDTEFKQLCDKLLEKKYLDKEFKYVEKECSYRIDVISNEPIIYCKYHGDYENIKIFNSMSVRNYFAYKEEGFYFLILIGCCVLTVVVRVIKSAIRGFIK